MSANSPPPANARRRMREMSIWSSMAGASLQAAPLGRPSLGQGYLVPERPDQALQVVGEAGLGGDADQGLYSVHGAEGSQALICLQDEGQIYQVTAIEPEVTLDGGS